MKSAQLQIRLTPAQKALLRRRAKQAGQDLSTYVLSRVAPPSAETFRRLLALLRLPAERRFALAALNEFLHELAAGEFGEAVATAEIRGLSDLDLNLAAAMVEQTAFRKGTTPPPWVRVVPPLDEPYFATDLKSLRAHLLRCSPVPYRRRNLFVDSGVGDTV